MENLLRNYYTVHYGLEVCTTGSISKNTNAHYFELNDDNTTICQDQNSGVAKFNNPEQKTITVINYELFVGLLPHNFKQGRNICDLVVRYCLKIQVKV